MNILLNPLREHDDAEWAPAGCLTWIMLLSVAFWGLTVVAIYLICWR